MNCNCATFEDLEFSRPQIAARAKATRALKKSLEKIGEKPDTRDRLMRCPKCDQLWQGSWAWGDFYAFRVPKVELKEWLALPFVQPDQLFAFGYSLHNLRSKGKF